MTTLVVRYTTKPDRAEENKQLVENVFAELAERDPGGLRYASFRLADGATFVHIASVETEDGSNPLAQVSAFAEFQKEIADRVVEAPDAQEASVVGSYRFFTG